MHAWPAGEDVAELHVHGGPAVVRGVLDALQALPHVRAAHPGEFTLRAFQVPTPLLLACSQSRPAWQQAPSYWQAHMPVYWIRKEARERKSRTAGALRHGACMPKQAGKLDLTEAEGLADLLAAETDAQRSQALAAAGGSQRRAFEAWRGALLRCLASVEALIDFGEEEGIAADVALEVLERARSLRGELEAHIRGGR
jgi:tRNA U34 5-carboxymethylaminomethyl modifying GTPase MnmE/TrmE